MSEITEGVAGRVFVNRTLFGVTETETEQLAVQKFVTNPAYVKVALGMTVNLGDFESARMDVSLSVPCYQEEVTQVYPKVQKWVEDRVSAEVDAIRSRVSALRQAPHRDPA